MFILWDFKRKKESPGFRWRITGGISAELFSTLLKDDQLTVRKVRLLVAKANNLWTY